MKPRASEGGEADWLRRSHALALVLDLPCSGLASSRSVFASLAVALALAAAPPGSTAERLRASGHPVEMSARGGLKIDLKAQTGHAKGDVVIQRDDVVVCCDEADAKFAGDKIERVECRGRVVIVRPDGTRARADVAIFDAGADQVTLSGGARLVSAQGDLAGESIIYDIARDRLEVAGKESRFRFRSGAKPPLELDRVCPPVP